MRWVQQDFFLIMKKAMPQSDILYNRTKKQLLKKAMPQRDILHNHTIDKTI
jgi:hypothetical protein